MQPGNNPMQGGNVRPQGAGGPNGGMGNLFGDDPLKGPIKK